MLNRNTKIKAKDKSTKTCWHYCPFKKYRQKGENFISICLLTKKELGAGYYVVSVC